MTWKRGTLARVSLTACLCVLPLLFDGCVAASPSSSGASGKNAEPASELEVVRAELISMAAEDQQFREAEVENMNAEQQRSWFERGIAADHAHTCRLKEIVAKHGWPTISRFGKEASDSAFLLAQHSDDDPEFQALCLPLLEQVAARGEASQKGVAYLTDRVRVKQRRPQVYGTQYLARELPDGSVAMGADGKLEYLLPIVEDIERLDERRAAMGLCPWREYEQHMARLQEREPTARPVEWDSRLPVDAQRGGG